jgi:hypothetical protein
MTREGGPGELQLPPHRSFSVGSSSSGRGRFTYSPYGGSVVCFTGSRPGDVRARIEDARLWPVPPGRAGALESCEGPLPAGCGPSPCLPAGWHRRVRLVPPSLCSAWFPVRLGVDIASAATRVTEVRLVAGDRVCLLLDAARLVEEQATGSPSGTRVPVYGDGVALDERARPRR